MKEDSKTNPQNQKSHNLDLISWRYHRMNKGDFSEKCSEKLKLIAKLNKIKVLK